MAATPATAFPAPGFADLIAPLNAAIGPLVKAGFGAPLLVPYGLVVLEVPGRKSGRLYSLPLTCWSFHDTVVVGTVRAQSQWMRNLAAAAATASTVTVWLRGRPRQASATVIEHGEVAGAQEGSRPELQPLQDLSRVFGASIAVLTLR